MKNFFSLLSQTGSSKISTDQVRNPIVPPFFRPREGRRPGGAGALRIGAVFEIEFGKLAAIPTNRPAERSRLKKLVEHLQVGTKLNQDPAEGEAIALEHNDVTAPDRSGGGEVMGQPVAEAADHVRTRAVFENQTKYLGIDGSVDVLEIAVREQAL